MYINSHSQWVGEQGFELLICPHHSCLSTLLRHVTCVFIQTRLIFEYSLVTERPRQRHSFDYPTRLETLVSHPISGWPAEETMLKVETNSTEATCAPRAVVEGLLRTSAGPRQYPGR